MSSPPPLAYHSPDPNPRIPWRAWVFLFVSWTAVIGPGLLVNVGQGPGANYRRVADLLRRYPLFSTPKSLQFAFVATYLVLFLMVTGTAFLACHTVKGRKSTPAKVIRLSAIGAVLFAAAVAIGPAYVMFLF